MRSPRTYSPGTQGDPARMRRLRNASIYEGSRSASSNFDDDIADLRAAFSHANYDQEMYE